VANSGLGGPNEPGPDDRFDDLVTTNLNGTYRSIRAFESHLAPGPEARHVVVIASILARIGVPGYTGYCASKAGLLGLVRSFAAELAPANVQVNPSARAGSTLTWPGRASMRWRAPGTRRMRRR